MLSLLFFSVLQLVLLAAWVSGYLDPYQKKLQEIILDTMGETKVSYGLKMSLTGKKLTEDQNLSKIQDQLGSQLGGVFGKGGLGEGIGSVLSKGL
ncbi:hypothetical protein N7541_005678 [Penicillium brevicompactum]|uniref:Uncharacterized protein n=1 Tax=Penicillium brevicompactum TaxID=5074 RepID=A0A9W9R9E7_PENBR|nr:uncharacterized protein N7506_002453 [Penicillium brevicompactum]KAJ5344088.1 hypothetical protein N7506_002453 [Penicillium brevicompactum]KAJ5354634.1 hypothetical protein N7541_005678 [Penicillium brevicompactum]